MSGGNQQLPKTVTANLLIFSTTPEHRPDPPYPIHMEAVNGPAEAERPALEPNTLHRFGNSALELSRSQLDRTPINVDAIGNLVGAALRQLRLH